MPKLGEIGWRAENSKIIQGCLAEQKEAYRDLRYIGVYSSDACDEDVAILGVRPKMEGMYEEPSAEKHPDIEMGEVVADCLGAGVATNPQPPNWDGLLKEAKSGTMNDTEKEMVEELLQLEHYPNDKIWASEKKDNPKMIPIGQAFPVKLRPEVEAFAQQMELVLRENDYKGGWKDLDKEYLLARLNEELDEVKDAGSETLLGELCDVANFAMMIADASGKLVYPAEARDVSAGKIVAEEVESRMSFIEKRFAVKLFQMPDMCEALIDIVRPVIDQAIRDKWQYFEGTLLWQRTSEGHRKEADEAKSEGVRLRRWAEKADEEAKRLKNMIATTTVVNLAEYVAMKKVLKLLDIEKLAETQHNIWASWMSYMLEYGGEPELNRWIMYAGHLKRWERQAETLYHDLSEEERESDRKVVREHMQELCEALAELAKVRSKNILRGDCV